MKNDPRQPFCPAPVVDSDERVLLAHGEGGAAMRRLVSQRILPLLRSALPISWDDAAVLPPLDGRPVLSTDAFVVSPLFFPGGDIGRLAVYGTVNDLVVRGAKPLWLTLSMVLEEGLSFDVLDRVLASVADAARECGTAVVAGDTKVVPRGAADGLFLSTTGLGTLVEPAPEGSAALDVGDQLLVSGPIGRHGVAVLAAREEMGFEPPPTSDCGALTAAVEALRKSGIRPVALRDATRGGVAAVLHEWSRDCGRTLCVEESRVPVSADVRGVCELLGLDPLCIANEGTMVAAVRAADGPKALAALQAAQYGAAAIIGEVRPRDVAPVVVRRSVGREQPLTEPAGAPLPRIC